MEGKYIGEKVIKSIGENNIVEFTDGAQEYFTDRQLEYVVTNEPLDATQFQNLVKKKVATEVLTIFEKHNVRQKDVQAILEMLASSINEYVYQAIGKAMGTYEEGEHSSHFFGNITMNNIKRFIDANNL